jgi:polyferredoxin
MVTQFLIGFAMIALTLGVGAVFIVAGAEGLRRHRHWISKKASLRLDVFIVVLVTLWLVVGLTVIMGAWAICLWALGILPDFESALYFSMICFTTLGFGDLILPEPWRLVSGFIAIDGFILFGLNTAFLFEVLRELRQADN